MQILALERDVQSIDPRKHARTLREEAACVWALKKQSVIREIWFTVRDRRAVLLLECASEAEAQEHLAGLPLVREGLITFDVLPLRSYDGFDRLIAPDVQAPRL